MCRPRGGEFVRISAGFSVPRTFSNPTSSDSIFSWIQRSVQSKWRILPTPRLRAIPMAAVASEYRVRVTSNPKSRASACNPSLCATPTAMPCKSVLPDESATVVFYFGPVFHVATSRESSAPTIGSSRAGAAREIRINVNIQTSWCVLEWVEVHKSSMSS